MSTPPHGQARWDRVDEFLTESLHTDAATQRVVQEALAASTAAGLPNIAVAPNQGKLLSLLASVCGARHVLEVGTLGGYSALWLAKGVGPGGRVVTLELDEKHARVARENFARAGVLGQIDLHVGRAADTIAVLEKEVQSGSRPRFDLTFIDADKPSTPGYLVSALRMSRPGSVIIIDNVVRDGEVANAASTDASVLGIRRAIEIIAAEPRLSATALQTVGVKGYDGFLMAVVTA
ncbi:MAG TPA: O-methyltransferase [Phycisphaerales bacterium]|nr:O-methyltransferase [Phycisphaerales bacterium]